MLMHVYTVKPKWPSGFPVNLRASHEEILFSGKFFPGNKYPQKTPLSSSSKLPWLPLNQLLGDVPINLATVFPAPSALARFLDLSRRMLMLKHLLK